MTGPVAVGLRAKFLAAVVAVLMLSVGAGVARYITLEENRAEAQRAAALDEDLRLARQSIERLQRRVAVLERGSQVTDTANEELRDEVAQRQKEIAGLRGDVEFYQRLLGAGGSSDGLAVHALQLENTPSDRVYRFVLTLSQNLKKARVVSGAVEFSIEGVRADRAERLGGLAIDFQADEPSLGFEFKYFQQLRGSFSLPEGFDPARVHVRLVPEGRGRKPLNREFDWAELMIETEDELVAEG